MSDILYTPDDFIKYYSDISDELWITNKYRDDNGNCCSLGHLGCRDHPDDSPNGPSLITVAGERLQRLIGEIRRETGSAFVSVADINDGAWPEMFPQKTPKARIIAALEMVKAIHAKTPTGSLTEKLRAETLKVAAFESC